MGHLLVQPGPFGVAPFERRRNADAPTSVPITSATPARESERIRGVYIVPLHAFADSRGYFFESFRQAWLPGMPAMIQGNVSFSKTGVLRGMHYHLHQADFWLAPSGHVRAALYDLRASSPTRGASQLLDLGEAHPFGLYIPAGVAHGFFTLAPSLMTYLVDRYYDNSDEHGVRWDDPALGLAGACAIRSSRRETRGTRCSPTSLPTRCRANRRHECAAARWRGRATRTAHATSRSTNAANAVGAFERPRSPATSAARVANVGSARRRDRAAATFLASAIPARTTRPAPGARDRLRCEVLIEVERQAQHRSRPRRAPDKPVVLPPLEITTAARRAARLPGQVARRRRTFGRQRAPAGHEPRRSRPAPDTRATVDRVEHHRARALHASPDEPRVT